MSFDIKNQDDDSDKEIFKSVAYENIDNYLKDNHTNIK